MIPWLTAFFGLNVADAMTTYAVLSQGGIEANPVFRPLVGSWEGYVVKLLLALAACLWLWLRRDDRRAHRVLYGGVGFYVLVVGFNLWGLV